jgi:hypothetical protein
MGFNSAFKGLNSALYKGEGSASSFGRTTTGKRSPGTPLIRRPGRPLASPDILKLKLALEQAMKVQAGSRCTDLFFP